MLQGLATTLYNAYESARRHHKSRIKSVACRTDFKESSSRKLELAIEVEAPALHQCPECERGMHLCVLDGVDFTVCLSCTGHWFEAGALRKLTGLDEDVPGLSFKSRPSTYSCPVCAVQMEEYVFINPKNLLVDLCQQCHGVYLESGEIERALIMIALPE